MTNGFFGFDQVPGGVVSGSVIGGSGLFGNVSTPVPLTVLLLHADVLNSSNEPIDSSVLNNPVALAGAGTLSAARSEFGPMSFFRPSSSGAVDSIRAPIGVGSLLDVLSGTTDFTIEGWVSFPNAPPSAAVVFDYGGSGNGPNTGNVGLNLRGGPGVGGINGDIRVNGGSLAGPWPAIDLAIVGAIDTVTFYHFAVQRVATVGQLFFNGIAGDKSGGWINYATPAPGVNSFAAFGWSDAYSNSDACYLDEMRVTRGLGRYTAVPGAAYVVPVAPFVPD